MEGFSLPDKRSGRVVLEANLAYWDSARFPRLQRITFDNTLGQKEAVELAKTGEGRVDLVTGLSPLETLRVAESPFAAVVKNRGVLVHSHRSICAMRPPIVCLDYEVIFLCPTLDR